MGAHPAGPRHGENQLLAGAPPVPLDLAELHHLDESIWPITAHRAAHEAGGGAAMVIGGVDVRDLARDFGTPLFVLDEDDFRQRARGFKQAYGDDTSPADVYFAGKSFLSIATARWIAEEGLNLDVCSGGELALALRAGFPPERIAFHGNNKLTDEMRSALAAGIGSFVVDSFEEIARLAYLAEDADVRARVLVRVTVGVEAHTHEFIATAHEDQKFGLSLATGDAQEAVRRVLKLPSLEFVGLHSHIGSQIFDAAGFEVAAHRVVELAAAIRDEHDVVVDEINLGGGMGIAYVSDDDPLDPADMASALRAIVVRECAAYDLPVPRLAVEPGRAIVGPSMVTIYEIGTIKRIEIGNGHVRTYVSVDGGMSDNIRTALYGADYTARLASRGVDPAAGPGDVHPMLTRIVGRHCESGDVVVRDAWLPDDLAVGDLIAVAATGAYCRAMASSYNYIPRPPVIAVRDGQATPVLRRETIEDLLALDVGV